MASDFTCSVTSVRDQGAAHIEQLTCTEVTSDSSLITPRNVEVARVIFPPEKLNLLDINARRRFLVSKNHGDKAQILSELQGIFRNTEGGKATEALAMSSLAEVAVVTGGIYFASSEHDRQWPQTGETTRQGDGFVWFKPDEKRQGFVLSEQQGNFTSGGYLLLDFKGNALLVRLGQMLPPTDDYRLIAQSNIVLVANGQEDGNGDKTKNAVAALSAQQDGTLSLIVAAEPGKASNGFGLTQKEFGQLLVSLGSRYAINLDGGPSAQFAVRKEGCQNMQSSGTCVENLIHNSDETNRMPQLFSVSK